MLFKNMLQIRWAQRIVVYFRSFLTLSCTRKPGGYKRVMDKKIDTDGEKHGLKVARPPTADLFVLHFSLRSGEGRPAALPANLIAACAE